ncbi:hypothetical protein PAECIP111891_02196 [Paenibacillus allorhizoplanae]|uniref:Tail fiber protein n=1 Tax=Paenibacillus allorhizoplanae TaxID=2905648 RepID=A0ABM9C695_9BACL|nr:hypothetical protein [Paenibacillus allorhizoplanae]CAH1203001.1 hypothetical protein PAECIP111891_02196 [Paenibacillus allorhizoplanae]
MTIDPATLSQVIDLKNKIGTNADAAGTSTLFSRLAQIANYVDQVEGYTDILETLLGLTGDTASGTGSVMARLAQLIAYTDTIETVLATLATSSALSTVNTTVNTINTNVGTKIGAAADAPGVGTLFGKIATVASFVGANTDNSSAQTLFGKIAAVDAKAAAAAAPQKSLCTNYVGTEAHQGMTLTTSFQNILSITGKGYLEFAYMFMSNNFKNNTYQIIIDGVTVLDVTLDTQSPYNVIVLDRHLWNMTDAGYYLPFNNGFSLYQNIGGTLPVPYVNAAARNQSVTQYWPDAIWFRSSIVIRAKTNTGTDSVSYGYGGAYY